MLRALATDFIAGFQQQGAGAGPDASSTGRFFVVQLQAWNASMDPANVYYHGAIAGLRVAQQVGVSSTPGAELVTAIDGGDPQAPATSIHPRGKQLPGHRLALAILAQRYGMQQIEYAAPRYSSATGASAQGLALQVSVRVSNSAGSTDVQLVWVPPSPDSNSSRCPTDLGVLPIMCAGFEIMLSDGAFPNGTWVPAAVEIASGQGGSLTLKATAPRAGLVAAGTRNGWGAWPVVSVYSASSHLPLLPWQERVPQEGQRALPEGKGA